MYILCFISHEIEPDDLLRPLQTLAVLCFYVFSFATVKGQGLLVLAKTWLLNYKSNKKKRQTHKPTVHIFISKIWSSFCINKYSIGQCFYLCKWFSFFVELGMAWRVSLCRMLFPTALLSWSSLVSLKCIMVKKAALFIQIIASRSDRL